MLNRYAEIMLIIDPIAHQTDVWIQRFGRYWTKHHTNVGVQSLLRINRLIYKYQMSPLYNPDNINVFSYEWQPPIIALKLAKQMIRNLVEDADHLVSNYNDHDNADDMYATARLYALRLGLNMNDIYED